MLSDKDSLNKNIYLIEKLGKKFLVSEFWGNIEIIEANSIAI